MLKTHIYLSDMEYITSQNDLQFFNIYKPDVVF
jgi:hypothetical protein